MKRKFKITAGELTYNEQHGFFHGWINGKKVTMNQITDKEGKVKWLVNEDLEVFEVQDKSQQPNY